MPLCRMLLVLRFIPKSDIPRRPAPDGSGRCSTSAGLSQARSWETVRCPPGYCRPHRVAWAPGMGIVS